MAAFRGRLAFCSNFYRVDVSIWGKTFPTSEHAYQWAKCADAKVKEEILATGSPGHTKRLGRTAVRVNDWESIKVHKMYEILKAKFSSPEMGAQLLLTGNEELVEHNEWGDTFWGVYNGKGQNHLGKLLMRVREELKEASSG